jgi:beta-lactamase regulating signal transducer with metallopeptidase domain
VDDLLSIAVSNAVAATVLALFAVAVSAVYRRPALMHGLWLLVLLKLVTPPLLVLPISWPNSFSSAMPESAGVLEEPTIATLAEADEPAPLAAISEVGNEEPVSDEAPATIEDSPRSVPAATEPILWPQLLQIVWALGALAWFSLALERLHHFRRLLHYSRPASAALQERTRRLAHSLGLSRCPRVRLLPGRIAPMLWAVGGPPRLLVPADLLAVVNDEQLDTLLLHELAHLRRRDHWVRVLEFVVMGLYWWHPVVWYARRELREAEEQCCDAWVVSTLPGTGRTYASALLDTLDFLSTTQAALPPLASGLGQIADLKRRLTMIMRGNTPRSLTWPGCLAVVALGLTCLPMLPSLHGQQLSQQEFGKFVADEQDAKSVLDKATADLELQKARLEQQRANLAAAEAELKKAIAAMENQKKVQQAKLQRQEAILSLAQLSKQKAGDKIPKITVEIVVNADAAHADVAELLNKLRKTLPENVRIHISTTEVRNFGVTPKKAPPTPRFQAPKPPVPPKPAKSPAGGQEQRINELEQRMEKMLRELQELRKQMKESRSEAPMMLLPQKKLLELRKLPLLAPAPAQKDPKGNPYYAPTVPLTPAPAAAPAEPTPPAKP